MTDDSIRLVARFLVLVVAALGIAVAALLAFAVVGIGVRLFSILAGVE